MFTRIATLILGSAFVLTGIALGIITINAMIQNGIEFAAVFFLTGSILMVREGVKGFKEAKKELLRSKPSKVLTIRY
jgi:hypothetical protein